MGGTSFAEFLYPKLPTVLQNLACTYYGHREARKRFNEEFHRKLEWLHETEFWSAGQVEAYQEEKLRALIKYAFAHVPWYREQMKALKLYPDDIRSRADLQKLPILTKEQVRQNASKLMSEAVTPQRLVHAHTSGTTGKSLEFYVSQSSVPFQWAVWWRHRNRFGLNFGDLHANFTGKLIVPPEQSHPPYWRWNYHLGQALLNMQHLTKEKVGAIVEFLNACEFLFYSGYPSVIHALALAAREAGVKLTSLPKVVVTGAENVLNNQRDDILEFTGARLTDEYGFAESCGNASHCPEFVYHEDFEFGILECVDPQTMEDGTVRGRIVATGFASPEFPFIRYETGDVAVWEAASSHCSCGRQSQLIRRIEGRIDDYVVTPECRRIMRFDYLFKDTANVKECQVVQHKLGEIELRVVRRSEFSHRDEQGIRAMVHRWISPQLEVHFEYVGEIERESNGKFRAVKSYVKCASSKAAS